MADGTIEGVVPDAANEAVLGKLIGTGTAREVHEHGGEPGRIVKASRGPVPSSNWTEWLLWNQGADTDLAKILGRYFAISQSGRYLVMERLRNLTQEEKQTPARRPCWITDAKPSAFGMSVDTEVKLRDYSQVNIGAVLAAAAVVPHPLKADSQMEIWARLPR